MSFHTLNELNIKLVDFITLLSPLGVVKKIVIMETLTYLKFFSTIKLKV